MKNLVLLFLSFITFSISAKILIITHAFNRPDFIEIQYKTFKKFLIDEYEFVVFNDAKENNICKHIEAICKKYNINCIRIPQNTHRIQQPSIRTADSINYSLKTLGFKHNDIVTIIDSDMFLVKEFSIREYLDGYDLAGIYQTRANNRFKIEYLWNGLVFLNMNTLPDKETINFNCATINGVTGDTGAYTHYYLKRHPEIKVKYTHSAQIKRDLSCNTCKRSESWTPCKHNTTFLKERGFDNTFISFTQQAHADMEYHIYDHFLHYRAGGNWQGKSQSYHDVKSTPLKLFINKILGK